MTPHDVLGLRPDATQGEVRAAWRRVAADTHPDHGGDPAAFARAEDAYRRLRASEPRAVVTVVRRPGAFGLGLRWWRRRRQRSRQPRVV